MKASQYKEEKYLTVSDIKKLCPNVVATEICDGPIIVINDQAHEAKTYTFDKIEEVIQFFSKKVNQHILIKNTYEGKWASGVSLDVGNSVRIFDSKNQMMNKLWGHGSIEIDEPCTLKLVFKSDDINKEYKRFVVRIYEPTDITSDTYKECDSIKECIIKDVESNLVKISNKSEDGKK